MNKVTLEVEPTNEKNNKILNNYIVILLNFVISVFKKKQFLRL